MSVYRLEDEIFLNAPLEEVWAFFTDPRTLQKITPDTMGFKHRFPPDAGQVYPGMLLTYRVSPIAGIPMTWVTRIVSVEPKTRFVDIQEKGPFAMWHHIHEFEPREGGCLVRDVLYYQLPLGFLGKIAHGLFVKRQNQAIFDHRKKVLPDVIEEFVRSRAKASA
jgi:ligand-binding SRPBCC domain-containing protein